MNKKIILVSVLCLVFLAACSRKVEISTNNTQNITENISTTSNENIFTGDFPIPKGNRASFVYADEQLGTGKLFIVMEGQDPLDMWLYYITKNDEKLFYQSLPVGLRLTTQKIDNEWINAFYDVSYDYTGAITSGDILFVVDGVSDPLYDSQGRSSVADASSMSNPSGHLQAQKEKIKSYILDIVSGKISYQKYQDAKQRVLSAPLKPVPKGFNMNDGFTY